ncbi:hypothetical protein [Dickeya sp. NCPPB 3274]|uniref:hypothetical protein n=1 Tax=Dickeya sp. NCPPB 3274 TaxID=568766 RepID=UPI0003A49328|nr:hypothetical protein [Dickeya sp. NCPPB 3274]
MKKPERLPKKSNPLLFIATLFAWKGEMVFAGTLITLDLIGLASVFVIGRYRPSNDSE